MNLLLMTYIKYIGMHGSHVCLFECVLDFFSVHLMIQADVSMFLDGIPVSITAGIRQEITIAETLQNANDVQHMLSRQIIVIYIAVSIVWKTVL